MKGNDQEIEYFFNDKFPTWIQRLANKMGADIEFEDEAGVGVMTRHGRTWGLEAKEYSIVKVSMQRGGYNVLSAVTAEGGMDY